MEILSLPFGVDFIVLKGNLESCIIKTIFLINKNYLLKKIFNFFSQVKRN